MGKPHEAGHERIRDKSMLDLGIQVHLLQNTDGLRLSITFKPS